MIYIIDDFEKKIPRMKIEKEPLNLKCGKTIYVYNIESIHEFTQYVGYGKYKNSLYNNVYLRGQTDLYNGTMIPSIYRGRTKIDSINATYNKRINQYKKDIKSLSKYPRDILEPMLQHYGVKTNWLDLVDNMWVALWFASHKAYIKTVKSREYIYYTESDEQFAYIYLMASDAVKMDEGNKGIYCGEETHVVDLRKALPSYFLRPHVQHAIMIRKNDRLVDDYSNLIVGIAKISMEKVKKWLGDSELMTTNSLFPSAYFDDGFAVLLRDVPQETSDFVKQFGSIQVISGI